ncbi:unnamed protein product [Amoebophrya sp. A25]|nr:unnamed protein product [Amoebophrya sp. A25]|eukprot:GSA25T00016597001.1
MVTNTRNSRSSFPAPRNAPGAVNGIFATGANAGVVSGSYLDSVSAEKKSRILELAKELRGYKGASKPQRPASASAARSGSGRAASSSSQLLPDHLQGGSKNDSKDSVHSVSSFLENVDAAETVTEIERQLAAANARIIEQEEQILALLEAKRQDTAKAHQDVQKLQNKIESLASEKRSLELRMDEVGRDRSVLERQQEKQRKQLKIECGHAEELRGLVVEMLDQAEFWKSRGAGDKWRPRLEKLVRDVTAAPDGQLVDQTDLLNPEQRNRRASFSGGQVVVDAAGDQHLEFATPEGGTHTVVVPGGSGAAPWNRPQWTDSVVFGERAAMKKKHELEIQKLQNQVEKLQKEKLQMQKSATASSKCFGGGDSATAGGVGATKQVAHDRKMLMDLCRKVKIMQDQNAQLRGKIEKDTVYIKRLEKRLLGQPGSTSLVGGGAGVPLTSARSAPHPHDGSRPVTPGGRSRSSMNYRGNFHHNGAGAINQHDHANTSLTGADGGSSSSSFNIGVHRIGQRQRPASAHQVGPSSSPYAVSSNPAARSSTGSRPSSHYGAPESWQHSRASGTAGASGTNFAGSRTFQTALDGALSQSQHTAPSYSFSPQRVLGGVITGEENEASISSEMAAVHGSVGATLNAAAQIMSPVESLKESTILSEAPAEGNKGEKQDDVHGPDQEVDHRFAVEQEASSADFAADLGVEPFSEATIAPDAPFLDQSNTKSNLQVDISTTSGGVELIRVDLSAPAGKNSASSISSSAARTRRQAQAPPVVNSSSSQSYHQGALGNVLNVDEQFDTTISPVMQKEELELLPSEEDGAASSTALLTSGRITPGRRRFRVTPKLGSSGPESTKSEEQVAASSSTNVGRLQQPIISANYRKAQYPSINSKSSSSPEDVLASLMTGPTPSTRRNLISNKPVPVRPAPSRASSTAMNAKPRSARSDPHRHEEDDGLLGAGVPGIGKKDDEADEDFDLSMLEKFTTDCASSLLQSSPGAGSRPGPAGGP